MSEKRWIAPFLLGVAISAGVVHYLHKEKDAEFPPSVPAYTEPHHPNLAETAEQDHILRSLRTQATTNQLPPGMNCQVVAPAELKGTAVRITRFMQNDSFATIFGDRRLLAALEFYCPKDGSVWVRSAEWRFQLQAISPDAEAATAPQQQRITMLVTRKGVRR